MAHTALCSLLLLATAVAQLMTYTGNHAISASTLDWQEVTVNPPTFGRFLTLAGRGNFTLALPGKAPQPLASLAWQGDVVFPGGSLAATLAPGVTLTLRSFAPLSPFEPSAGFLAALLGSFSLSGSSVSVTLGYSFQCSGDWEACMGDGRGQGPSACDAAAPQPCALNVSNGVFLGAVGGAAATLACPHLALLPPPIGSFRLVANNSVTASACAFHGWGCGGPSSCPALPACELACAEDPACTTVNFAASTGDCVLRVCADAAHPPVVAQQGYAVYTSAAPKVPRPLLCASLTLTPQAPSGALVLGLWDPAGHYAAAYPSPALLFSHLSASLDSLAAQHSAFTAALPATGQAHFDASIRWLLAPAVLLTKGVGERVSTMGYVEMCARDSFHTTWLHSYMWPTLERAMVGEFCEFQCNASTSACGGVDGKIPTTVLPLIYRSDNIDVTAYFVLRAARYVEASGDVDYLRATFPCLQRALAYLISRDTEGSGLPAHKNTSFWADWLDVDYMLGRKYAPHTAFTYTAAMLAGERAAAALGEGSAAEAYGAAAARAAAGAEALLWSESAGVYLDAWWAGARPARYPAYALGDQAAAIFLALPLPKGRALAVLQGLGAWGLVKQYGMVDIFPFLPAVDDPQGVYGNGGNYPWLTCMLINSLLTLGATSAQGLALFQAMADQMLHNASQPAQNVAWEYMSASGLDMGAFPHGETAACFAVASRGATRWDRVSPQAYHLGLLHANTTALLVRPLHGVAARALLVELQLRQGSLVAVRLAVDAVWDAHAGAHAWLEHPTARCLVMGALAVCKDDAPRSALHGLRITVGALPVQ